MENKKVLLEVKGLQFVCLVKDKKVSFGIHRLLISPESGTGETWVNANNVKEMEG